MSVQTPEARAAERRAYEEPDKGAGWVTFAAIMLMIVGTLNAIYGIAAVSNSKFFVNGAKYVFSDLNTWGWIVMIIGFVQVATAFGVLANSRAAAWVGVLFASLNAIAQLLFLPSSPFLSLSLFSLDVLVIYGLATYGGRLR
jgi:hypothetical protein